MKILIVMSGFFPGKKYGGPPVSVDNFCSLMKEQDCYIVTHDHDLFEQGRFDNIHEDWNDRGNCKVMYLSDELYNKSTFEKTIAELKPNLLYLQGLFQSCVFPCLQLAKRERIPVLLAPRGELCAGALNLKKWKKLPYLKMIKAFGLVKDIHWQSTSDEETEAIENLLNVDESHIHLLDNIPSLPKKIYTRINKTVGEGRFVFLSRIHPKKNLLSAIRYFENVEGNVWFDIYGPVEDGEYWEQCQEAIKKLPENITVEYKGLVSHDQVHEVFSKYDAFLFPTLSENYGHVIAESLIVGTPVIISDQTPWRCLEEYGAGWDIPLDENSKFASAISKVIMCPKIDADKAIEYVNKKVELSRIKETYRQCLYKIIGEKR